jgi:hypothetical protein
MFYLIDKPLSVVAKPSPDTFYRQISRDTFGGRTWPLS